MTETACTQFTQLGTLKRKQCSVHLSTLYYINVQFKPRSWPGRLCKPPLDQDQGNVVSLYRVFASIQSGLELLAPLLEMHKKVRPIKMLSINIISQWKYEWNQVFNWSKKTNKKNVSQLPALQHLLLCSTFFCKHNSMQRPSAIMVKNPEQGIWEHSWIQNHSGSSLVIPSAAELTGFQLGLGQRTEKVMSKAWFCGVFGCMLWIIVLLEDTNMTQLGTYWQREPDFHLKAPGLSWSPNKVLRSFVGKKAAPYYKSSTIFNSYFPYIYPSLHANSTLSACCQKVLFLYHLTIEPGFSQSSNRTLYTCAHICG